MLFAVMAYFSFSLLDTVQKTAVITIQFFNYYLLNIVLLFFYLSLNLLEKKIIHFTSQVILKFNY